MLVDEASSTSFTRKIASPSALSYLVGADPRLANGAVPCLADRGTVSGRWIVPRLPYPPFSPVLYCTVHTCCLCHPLGGPLKYSDPHKTRPAADALVSCRPGLAHPSHICTGTRPTPPKSALGLAHRCHICAGTGFGHCHICTRTCAPLQHAPGPAIRRAPRPRAADGVGAPVIADAFSQLGQERVLAEERRATACTKSSATVTVHGMRG